MRFTITIRPPSFSFKFLLILILQLIFTPIYSDDHIDVEIRDAGRYYIRNFDYKEYGAHQENWQVIQGPRGMMYVANNWGILEFDGVSWRLIKTKKNTAVLSIAVDTGGTVYAGLENDFGYLKPDSTGKLRYVSLETYLSEAERKVSNVWRTHAVKDGVYFYTGNKIYFWQGDSISITPNQISCLSATVNDTMYFGNWENGIMRMVDGSPQTIPGGDRFSNVENQVIIPYDAKGTFLVATRQDGLLLYNGTAFVPFASEANAFIKQNLPYSGTSLGEDRIIIGTIRGGAAIINADGALLKILDTETGLRNQTIVSAAFDKDGDLWLALLNGIAHVETSTPLTRFDAESGLEGGVVTINRHGQYLYAGTDQGIFYLDSESPGENRFSRINKFKRVEGNTGFVWGSYITDGKLFIGTDNGAFIVEGKQANRIEAAWPRVYGFYQSQKDAGRIYVALQTGISIMKKHRGQWQHEYFNSIPGTEITSIAGENSLRNDKEIIWLGTDAHGVMKAIASDSMKNEEQEFQFEFTTYSEQHSLPPGAIKVLKVNGKIVFATEKGLRRFDSATETFPAEIAFGDAFADTSRFVSNIINDGNGQMWIVSRSEDGSLISTATGNKNGGYEWETKPFRRITDLGDIRAICPDKNGVAWFGGSEGVVRYSLPSTANDTRGKFGTNIRRVLVNGDSVVYGGASISLSKTTSPASLRREERENSSFEGGLRGMSPTLTYQNNALRFEYAATFYKDLAANQYQYRLEGFDESWSNWSHETQKDYTNLREGDYRFRVRAKNVYGQQSETAIYEFTILPPWQRTWWAYLVYAILVGLAITAIIRMQIKRVQRRAAEALQREKERAKLQETTLRAQAAELKAQAAEAEKEREKELMRSRIASDLHDEIGSNLSSIAVISQMLRRRDKIEEKERQRLGDIYGISQQTAASMRDIVWFVNPENDSMEKLLAKMRETANMMLDHLEFTFQTPNQPLSLETDLNFRRNLFLMYKESLQNIVKHSQASSVEIEITEKEDVFILRVADNGVGFDVAKPNNGNGLRNFYTRAKASGGEIEILSKPGGGTEVKYVKNYNKKV